MIVLNLPYPPSINNYWIASGNRRFVSKRGREFKNAVAKYCAEFRVPKFGDKQIWVDIFLYPRSKVLMDIDNCIKPILDALQDAGVFDDDVQVHWVRIERGMTKKGGGCLVMIDYLETESPVQGESGVN
jgi:crossover junction endodeoxyribonuclease RusA